MFNFNYLTVTNKKHALITSAVVGTLGLLYVSYNLGMKYCSFLNNKLKTKQEKVDTNEMTNEMTNENTKEEVIEEKQESEKNNN